jgi:hypothetical protein
MVIKDPGEIVAAGAAKGQRPLAANRQEKTAAGREDG